MWTLWSCTPTVTAMMMLLVVTREGYTREGWKVLGLHRLGLNVWWIAFGVTLLISLAASAVVWATPLASFVVPEDGILGALIHFLIYVGLFAVWFALAEEIGIRGKSHPKLMSLGRRRALSLVGLRVCYLAHAPDPAHHGLPRGKQVDLLPPVLWDRRGRKLLLRLPHALHGQRVARLHRARGAQRSLGRPRGVHRNLLPGAVYNYLAGDYGLLILVGAVIGTVWLGRRLMRS